MLNFTSIFPSLMVILGTDLNKTSPAVITICFFSPILFYLWHIYRAKSRESKLLPLRKEPALEHTLNAFIGVTVLILKADRRDSQTKLALLRHTVKKFEIQSKNIQSTFEKVWENPIGIKHLTKWMNRKLSNENRELLIYMLVEMAVTDGSVTTKEYEIIEELALKVGLSSNQLRSMIAAQRQKKAREEAEAHQRQNQQRRQTYTSVPSASKREQAAEILGVSPLASAEEIKKAYRGLVKKYHPDRFANESDLAIKVVQERFIEIQEAYECLTGN